MDQSLLTGSIKFGSSVDEAPGPSLIEGTVFRERERKRQREKEGSLDLPERPELPERPPKYRKDQRIIGGYFLY